MPAIGQRAQLTILREQPFGIFLDAGDELGEVLLPRREMPKHWQIGGIVDVFLYLDSEDRPVATLKYPKVMPGEFAYLEALSITSVGAFLDWGLPKDLLLPFREQKERIEPGKSYVVHVHVDGPSGRIVATRRVSKFLNKTPADYKEGQEVELMLFGKTELGYKAIIEGKHSGVLFANEVFRRLRAGEKTKGYIVKVHPEGKIDLSLYPPGRARINDLETLIEEELTKRGGFWAISDSSPAEEIHKALGVSKKAFKQATGALFKKRKITIGDDGIRLVKE
ncbi:CvfB family protein [Luteolibacter soli]|uniref:S1-like domain-containing RNA-binding protein n=1 Tax=Luteolibacter soli TaxID=3135280 RepID=A0ABU9AZC1_9BACT